MQGVLAQKKKFCALFQLCKVAVSFPFNTASCGWRFSALKMVKTDLRSTMKADEGLSNLVY